MRVPSINSFAATLVVWLVPLANCITVPSGKLTPISPAKPTPQYVNPHAPSNSAPVVEYSQDSPEPPPLDPSYVPVHYDFFNTLSKHHVYYVPMRFRNFNSISNEVEYEPPQKYYPGQTLGKNLGYNSFKQQIYWRQPVWTNQYNTQVDNNNVQYNQQQDNQFNQYNRQADNNVNNYNNQQQDNQYNVQPTPEQQQQQEALSTQSAPVTTLVPQASHPQVQVNYSHRPRKVDYSTGKGSYDVTGKGGSKSEYYSLGQDWSKKSAYPKKVLDQGLSHKKYPSHKY